MGGALMLDPDFPLRAPPDKEYVGGAEAKYCAFAVAKAVEAIGKACAAMRPVVIAVNTASALRDFNASSEGARSLPPPT